MKEKKNFKNKNKFFYSFSVWYKRCRVIMIVKCHYLILCLFLILLKVCVTLEKEKLNFLYKYKKLNMETSLYPSDYAKIHEFLEICKKYYKLDDITIIFDLFNRRFFKYIGKKGLCGRKSRIVVEDNYCKKHAKYHKTGRNSYVEGDVKKRTRKKMVIYKCNVINKHKKPCQRNVSLPGQYCSYHSNTSEMANDSDNKIEVSLYAYDGVHNVRQKEKIVASRFDFKKYRDMEMLRYLVDNGFNIKNDGIRKKVQKDNWYLTINLKNNLFIDNNNRKYFGRGLLNLVAHLHKINIFKAIDYIDNYLKINNYNILDFLHTSDEDMSSGAKFLYSEMPKIKVNKNNDLPVKNNDNIKNVIKYLRDERKININIIMELIDKKLLYADNRSNCVFTNENGTFSLSKGITSIKFNKCSGVNDFITYGNTDRTIYVFESPIDALSYMDLHNKPEGRFLSTNGEMMINKIMDYVKKNNTKEIYTCFDNDEKGIKFHDMLIDDRIKNNLNIKIYKIIPKGKDFNDELKLKKI